MENLACTMCTELNFGSLCDRDCCKDEVEEVTQWFDNTAEDAGIARVLRFTGLGEMELYEEELRRAKDLLGLLKEITRKKVSLGERYEVAPGEVQLRFFAAHERAMNAVFDAFASIKKMAAEERVSRSSFLDRNLQAV